jgi:G3E family GTPase
VILADTPPDFTPVTLITGFLGSGKTTLLQRLLLDPALSDTAVLINEFGEIGLDHHLLERIDEAMVMLQSGCVCCTIRGELSTAIKDLHSRRERGLLPPFRRLVVESTGLADPFPILSTVRSDPVLRHHFCLGNVITTVDAVNGARQLDAQPESIKQVAVADRLVLLRLLRHVTKRDHQPLLITVFQHGVEILGGEGRVAPRTRDGGRFKRRDFATIML